MVVVENEEEEVVIEEEAPDEGKKEEQPTPALKKRKETINTTGTPRYQDFDDLYNQALEYERILEKEDGFNKRNNETSGGGG